MPHMVVDLSQLWEVAPISHSPVIYCVSPTPTTRFSQSPNCSSHIHMAYNIFIKTTHVKYYMFVQYCYSYIYGVHVRVQLYTYLGR